MNKNSKISLTTKEIEKELKRENYKLNYINLLKNTIFTLIVVAAFSTIIASFILSILEINGTSMNPTLKEGEVVIAKKDSSIEQKDVIAFYQGNKILVKRVIATSGSFVNIDEKGYVYVDGKRLNETYIKEFNQGDIDIEFPYQVPDGHYFVLGDKRDTSIDSRNSKIGAVSKENIIGKVIINIWPLNKIRIVK